MYEGWLATLLEKASMTHEPGRERHMMHRCEHCGGDCERPTYVEAHDEYWCDDCIDEANEIAWERHQQSLMENGPGPTLAEQAAEARKFK